MAHNLDTPSKLSATKIITDTKLNREVFPRVMMASEMQQSNANSQFGLESFNPLSFPPDLG